MLVIVTIAMQIFKHYVNIQLFVVHMSLHASIKQNRKVTASINNVVTSQRLPSRLPSVPSQFDVNEITMQGMDNTQQCVVLIVMFVSNQYQTQHVLRPNCGFSFFNKAALLGE